MYIDSRLLEQRRKAVIHLLEIKKLKNPNKVTMLDECTFIHTNMRNKTTEYRVFDTFEKYKASKYYPHCKHYKVMTYDIVEIP